MVWDLFGYLLLKLLSLSFIFPPIFSFNTLALEKLETANFSIFGGSYKVTLVVDVIFWESDILSPCECFVYSYGYKKI